MVFVLGALGALGVGYLVVVYPDERGAGTGTAELTLDQHSQLGAIADTLAAQGALPRPRMFELYARVLRADRRLKRGRILVTRSMTARELLQRIASGYGSASVKVTVPEGWTRFEIAQRLADWGICDRAAFLAATESAQLRAGIDPRAPSAEGFLFPDTYWLHDGMAPASVAERMIGNARKRWSELTQSESAALVQLKADFGFDVFEIVTLASIVEKEAHVASEQPLIAGVFLNRLRDPSFRPKRLQADPTVAYGCMQLRDLPSCARFDGKRITRTMTADPANPYNTYRYEGLPPGPIANPGISALRAVLRPALHGYFYFVARGDGRHAFTENLKAHGEAVQQAALASPPNPSTATAR